MSTLMSTQTSHAKLLHDLSHLVHLTPYGGEVDLLVP